MHSPAVIYSRRLWLLPAFFVAVLLPAAGSAWAEGKADKPFHALTVDAKGVEMEIAQVVFYWEAVVSQRLGLDYL